MKRLLAPRLGDPAALFVVVVWAATFVGLVAIQSKILILLVLGAALFGLVSLVWLGAALLD